MKKSILLSLLIGMMGVIAFMGCERETINPNEGQQQRAEDTTASSQNEDPDIIKGHVVALLGDCIGNMMIISVKNDTVIGTNQDLYGNNCFRIYDDTLFVYDNVIGLPLPFNFYNNEYRYLYNGDTLRSIDENDYFEFKCQPIDAEEYSLLFETPAICPADLDGPSNMNLFKITEIKKYIKL